MICTIDHTDPGAIPLVLCRICTPVKAVAGLPAVNGKQSPAITGEQQTEVQVTRYNAKMRRRLRRDLRKLSKEIDQLKAAGVGQRLIEKSEGKLGRTVSELARLDN
jgi:hypothetical protein